MSNFIKTRTFATKNKDMIKSMTGFGRAGGEFGDKKFVAEVKSVNSKNFDCNTRMPSSYKEKEIEIRRVLSSELDRGKIDFLFYYEDSGADRSVTIDKDLAKVYYSELNSLVDELEIDSDNMLSVLMKMPDVMTTSRKDLGDEEWQAAMATIKEAVVQMDKFRRDEGATLEKDFRDRITTILDLLGKIVPFEGQRIEKLKARILGNLNELSGVDIDQNRFEQELIFYLEKLDITEEKVRLETHCKYFLEVLDSNTSEGKKLGFISQEIGREINTIGSKANDADMQRFVVQMKDELEKIKEQLLNVL